MSGVDMATLGLVLDMIGVVALFWFGMPPTPKEAKYWKDRGLTHAGPYDLIVAAEGSEAVATEDDAKRVNQWKRRNVHIGRLALVVVVIGFGLQIWALHL